MYCVIRRVKAKVLLNKIAYNVSVRFYLSNYTVLINEGWKPKSSFE